MSICRAVTKKIAALNFLDESSISVYDCHGVPKQLDHTILLRQRIDYCMDKLPINMDDTTNKDEYVKQLLICLTILDLSYVIILKVPLIITLHRKLLETYT